MKTLFRLISLTLATGSFAVPSAHSVLLLYYNFDDGAVAATDSSGGGHFGTILGATYTPAGQGYNNTPGRSMDFNFASDIIQVDDGAIAFDSLSTTGAATIAFWVFGDLLGDPRPGSPVTNFSAFGAAQSRQLMAHVPWEDGVVYFDAAGGNAPGVHRIFNDATADQFEGGWDHWIFIKEPGMSSIYVNNTLFHTGSTSASFGDIESFAVGNNGQNFNEGYRGLMDEFAVWDHALDAAERTQVYNGVIPEPTSAALLTVASGAFFVRRRRRGNERPGLPDRNRNRCV